MNVRQLLEHLHNLGIELTIAQSGDLRCRGAASVLTARLLDEIRANKVALVRHLQLAAFDDAPGFPLSPAQEQVWFEQQLAPDNTAYNLSTAVRLRGPLDLPALETALVQTVARHPVLNSRIESTVHGSRQVLLEQQAFVTQRIDFSVRGDNTAIERATDWLQVECDRPFDMATGPFVRASIARLGADDHILLLSRHHVASDGWSLAIFTRDLNSLYRSALSGDAPALPPLTARFEDFCRQTRARLAGPEASQQLAYWRDVLERFQPPAENASNAPFEPGLTRVPSIRYFNVPQSRYQRVQALARSERLSPFTVLLSTIAFAFGSRRQRHQVLLGTDVSTRDSAAHEMLVGHFVNPVALLIDWSTDMTVADYLQRTRLVLAGAMSHKDVPMAWVLRSLRESGSAPHGNAIDLLFGMHNNPHCELSLAPDISVELLQTPQSHALYDLCCYLTDTPEGLSGEISASEKLGGALTAQNLLDDFLVLTEALILRPELLTEPLDAWAARLGAKPSPGEPRQLFMRKKQAALQLCVKHSANTPPGSAASSAEPAPPPLPGEVAARARRVRDTDLVERARAGHGTAPAIYRRKAELEVLAWLEIHRVRLLRELHECGAVLFRDFDITTSQFPGCVQALAEQVVDLTEDTSPRSRLAEHVYTSTDYPPNRAIRFHNENSYAAIFPSRLFFFCEQPSVEGGQTPLADGRLVLRNLPNDIVKEFQRRHWCYVRNYQPHIGLSWQQAFATDSRAQVESYCKQHGTGFKWLSDEHLRTVQRRRAIAVHPANGEQVWFNHITFFNRAMLDEDLRAGLHDFDNAHIPNNTYYGDGGEIDTSVLKAIDAAYAKAAFQFDWCKGDLLLLDNVAMAHARRPYSGDRRIRVMMADPVKHNG